ncbi:hypothetical protein HMPREF3224_01691 [Anaerococcus hydrogenalis]|nr:hypothetical protein HMPREF3224_01691 [Anaerococcus hydrogenalis]
MKKNSKILILGLGLSLAFAPINSLVSSNINIAYAVEENNKKQLTLDEYIDQAKKFMDSDAFKKFENEDQENYKNLLENLSVENLDQEKSNEIVKDIEKIKLSYEYKELKAEVLKLKADSLSDDLSKELESYEASYDTYEDYKEQIKNLENTKLNIENYNKDLEKFKKILKDGLDINKNSGIDLKSEKAILENGKSKLKDLEGAINSLNKKVEANNAEVEEKNRQANLKTLEKIIDQEKEIKKATYYKKASQSLKDKFNQSLESIKSAYNKEEVNNIDVLTSAYDSALKNLDGNKFLDEHKKLIEYFENNKDKLSGEDQEKFAKLINELPNKEDSNLESISKLKAEIENAIKENPQKGNLKKVSRQVAVPKGSGTKKSRSFVRTGVKSVGIVLVVLILAGIAYFFASKKSKNNK